MLEMPPKTQNNNEESPEYVDKLKKELELVENKNREFNSKQIINENKLKKSKEKLIGQLFEMMKENGVDPNDMESINNFLRKLEEQDPDLLVLFEAIFKNITGDDVLPEEQEAPLPNNSGASSPLPPTFPNPPLPDVLNTGTQPAPPSSPLLNEQSGSASSI